MAQAAGELFGRGLGDARDAGAAVELGVDLGVRPAGEVDQLLGGTGVGLAQAPLVPAQTLGQMLDSPASKRTSMPFC